MFDFSRTEFILSTASFRFFQLSSLMSASNFCPPRSFDTSCLGIESRGSAPADSSTSCLTSSFLISRLLWNCPFANGVILSNSALMRANVESLMSFKNVLIASPKCLYIVESIDIVSLLTLAFLLSQQLIPTLIISWIGIPSVPNSSIISDMHALFSTMTFGATALIVFLHMYLITNPGPSNSAKESKLSLHISLYLASPILSDKNGMIMVAARFEKAGESLMMSQIHWSAALTTFTFFSFHSFIFILMNQKVASYISLLYSCSNNQAASFV